MAKRCVGPFAGQREIWLAPLGALLSSEKDIVDEPCHVWLIKLIIEHRANWESAGVRDLEREVQAIEEEARSGLERQAPSLARDTSPLPSPVGLAELLASLSQQGRAAGAAYDAWDLRNKLAHDLERAAAIRHVRAQAAAGSAAAIVVSANERMAALDAETVAQRVAAKELRHDLGGRAESLQGQLSEVDPAAAQIQREIEEAETMQRELLRQVGQLSERLQELRRRRAEGQKQEERLNAELHKVEDLFAAKLAAEDLARQQIESARALATAVADLASGYAQAERNLLPQTGPGSSFRSQAPRGGVDDSRASRRSMSRVVTSRRTASARAPDPVRCRAPSAHASRSTALGSDNQVLPTDRIGGNAKWLQRGRVNGSSTTRESGDGNAREKSMGAQDPSSPFHLDLVKVMKAFDRGWDSAAKVDTINHFSNDAT
jgi:hypothetical protein